jgi:hypothetical protein
MAGRNLVRTGETGAAQEAIERARDQVGHKQEQTAKLGAELPWSEIQFPDVGAVGTDRSRAGWPLLIQAAGQSRKTFTLEDLVDGHGAEGLSVTPEGLTDLVDGKILFA